MRIVRLIAAALVLLTAACSPLGANPTPTLVPFQLADKELQQAVALSLRTYAELLGYQYRNASYTVLDSTATKAAVHVTVSFQTRKGFAWEDHDAMVMADKSSGTWQALPISSASKINWDMTPLRGPQVLKSGAGFSVNLPEGWVAYLAPDSELKPSNVCGVGADPVSSVSVLVVMPTGYSVENVPLILRGFQQCPRSTSLSVVRQKLEAIRATDTTLKFQRLEMTTINKVPALVAQMTDENGAVAYDYYIMHRDRQLEFVVQAQPGLDVTQLISIVTGMVLN